MAPETRVTVAAGYQPQPDNPISLQTSASRPGPPPPAQSLHVVVGAADTKTEKVTQLLASMKVSQLSVSDLDLVLDSHDGIRIILVLVRNSLRKHPEEFYVGLQCVCWVCVGRVSLRSKHRNAKGLKCAYDRTIWIPKMSSVVTHKPT